MSLGNYTNAMKCYEEQLDRAKELRDSTIEAQAFGNLGIARLNMGHFEDAIGYFEQQLATLEQVSFQSVSLFSIITLCFHFPWLEFETVSTALSLIDKYKNF